MEDPGIKLFGKKIVLPATNNNINLPEDDKVNPAGAEKDVQSPNCNETKAESDNPKTPSIDEETKHESTNQKPKNLKKLDKILPCPRCTSMDTKFCYYNNYNVNQPRHFCKSCQRYWTAGGAMRTIAVGAGRRKSKNPAARPCFINISPETVTTSNSINSNSNSNSNSSSKVHCIPGAYIPIPIPVPAICPPMPIYPSTYWNCIPFLHPPTPTITDSILGKRTVDEYLMKTNDCDDELKKPKNSILIPKALRIDDPDEAARSSIWTTLGIRNENFNAFQDKSKRAKKHHETTTPPAHQANPAAFSRSVCFQETA